MLAIITFQLYPNGRLAAAWRSGGNTASAVFTRLGTSQPAALSPTPATAEQGARLAREAWDALQDGRHAEALPKAEEALALRERLLGPRHPDIADSLNLLGEVYRAQGRLDDAVRID